MTSFDHERALAAIEKQKFRDRERQQKIALFLVAYAVPALLLITLLLWVYQPLGINQQYTLKVGGFGDTSHLRPLYIEQTKSLSKSISEGDKTYRQIINTKPFNVTFNPPINLRDDSNITLTVTLETTGSDLYINNELVLPDLSNYTLLQAFDKDMVYIRDDLFTENQTINYPNENNSKDFLVKNFPGTTVFSTTYLNLDNPIISDYKKKEGRIEGTFRDNLELAVYGENIQLSFTKQDLNWYNGSDEYTVTVRDINQNIIFVETYKDFDTKIATKDLGSEKTNMIKLNNSKGFYFFKFTKDKNNRAADSTLKNIKVNSNKIMIIGNFLPMSPFSVYTKNVVTKNINFYYWWPAKNQTLEVEGTRNSRIGLNEDYLSKKYEYSLKPGNYTVSSPKGYLWVYSNLAWSTNEESFFDIPLVENKVINKNDFIVLDKSKVIMQGNDITVAHWIQSNNNLTFSMKATKAKSIRLTKLNISIK